MFRLILGRRVLRTFAAVVTATALSACSGINPTADNPNVSVRNGSGVVESIDVVRGNDPGLIGAIVGGVAGGAVGTQIGGGRGTAVATIAGVIGGALAGREVERRVKARDSVHRVVVRMDDGSRQTVAMETAPNVSVGNRVHIDQGQIVRD